MDTPWPSRSWGMCNDIAAIDGMSNLPCLADCNLESNRRGIQRHCPYYSQRCARAMVMQETDSKSSMRGKSQGDATARPAQLTHSRGVNGVLGSWLCRMAQRIRVRDR